MSSRILVIDGDISLSTVLSDYLSSRGYEALAVHSGQAGIESIRATHWDMIIMELQGLGMNGFALLKEIRQRLPHIPLIVLTTRTDREDQMKAFELGADDYQFKPFTMDILICRIEAILRRVRAFEENRQRVFDLNGHVFDSLHQTFDGQHMSSRESDLLLMLCRHEGDIVEKHHILTALWKADNAFTARSLGVYINHLRRFILAADYRITAVRNRGYKLVFNH